MTTCIFCFSVVGLLFSWLWRDPSSRYHGAERELPLCWWKGTCAEQHLIITQKKERLLTVKQKLQDWMMNFCFTAAHLQELGVWCWSRRANRVGWTKWCWQIYSAQAHCRRGEERSLRYVAKGFSSESGKQMHEWNLFSCLSVGADRRADPTTFTLENRSLSSGMFGQRSLSHLFWVIGSVTMGMMTWKAEVECWFLCWCGVEPTQCSKYLKRFSLSDPLGLWNTSGLTAELSILLNSCRFLHCGIKEETYWFGKLVFSNK